MPKNQVPLSAPADDRAIRRSLRAVRARRAAAAVVCGVLAFGGGPAVAADGEGQAPKASAASDSRLSGATIAAAQEELGVVADGVVGPVTRAAIREYQRAQDLKVTGRLDQKTLSALGLRARAVAANGDGGAAAGETPKRETSSAVPAELRAALERIAECESGGDPRAVSANGLYRGKYQFHRQTWRGVGGRGDPAKASEREQDRRAAILYQRTGPSSWPVCGQ
ncbi:MAG: transglycosylase family protein [Solirubrobacteraceae bacterium]